MEDRGSGEKEATPAGEEPKRVTLKTMLENDVPTYEEQVRKAPHRKKRFVKGLLK